MKFVDKIICCLGLVLMVTAAAKSQTVQSPVAEIPHRPSPSKPVNCETMLEYLDDSLAKATKFESNLVVLVRSNKGTARLNSQRSRGLTRYFSHRGFKDFHVGVDLISNVSDRVDLFVRGELLYSLPIGRDDNLDFTPCVIGDI